MPRPAPMTKARTRMLEAALSLIRAKGPCGFILAKATGGAEIAADSIDHLRRYVEMLFGAGQSRQNV